MTVYSIYNISKYFQWAGSFLILVSCLPMFEERLPYIKVLSCYAFISVGFTLAQQIAQIFFANLGINSIGNGFVFFEALLLGMLYYVATRNSSFRKGILVSLVFYVTFYSLVFFLFAEFSFSYIRLARDFLMILYALSYFYYLIRRLPEENLLKFPMFWINAAVIFYFSGTFILSFFRDYIVIVLKDDSSGFWAFRNFFRLAFCLVLSYAGWLDWRSIKSKKVTMHS